jgi:hypothetical protein
MTCRPNVKTLGFGVIVGGFHKISSFLIVRLLYASKKLLPGPVELLGGEEMPGWDIWPANSISIG